MQRDGEGADVVGGGVEPQKVLRTGEGQPLQGDPLVHIERELEAYKFIEVQGCPPFTGASLSSW